MHDEQAFLRAMQQNPHDNALRLVFADWLDERGDARGELIRLLHTLTQSIEVRERSKLEDRLRSLVASGIQPVGPFWTNSIGMKFAWIPAGTFLLGSPENEEGREKLYERLHQVTLTRGFYLAIYPVTQVEWGRFLPNMSKARGRDRPVENISWNDCQIFLHALSESDGHAYRFPSEAEWEYACRAGTTTPFYFGDTISPKQANYDGRWVYGKGKEGQYRMTTTRVDKFPPNAWGLYDMHGNVCEWCADWLGKYPRGRVVDPQGPKRGEKRVLRGGSWSDQASCLRSAVRHRNLPSYPNLCFGLRPVMKYLDLRD
jgi:uncharacterized protein (TIGR02996 family)